MKAWHQLKAYSQFLARSTNQHGVHSPFVFRWMTQCLYDRKTHAAYKDLANYAQRLQKDNTELDVLDLGAGSRVFAQTKRRVKEMAKHAGSTQKRAKLLYRCAKYFQSDYIIELGTSLGKGTQALALGAPNTPILSIEGCPNTANYTQNALRGYPNIKIQNQSFDAFFASTDFTFLRDNKTLIFVDGHHQGDALLRYVKQLLPYVNEDTVWILDDIHWSKDMEDAWESIKTWPEIPVTVDTFRWGFVFFRYGQAEEHFTVRP